MIFDPSQSWADSVQKFAGETVRAGGETDGVKDGSAAAELIHDLGVVAMPQAEPWRVRARTVLSVSLSLLLHSSAVAAILLAIEQTDIGAVSLPSEAISVEIVSSSVLEAMQQKEIKDEAAQAQATDSKTGAEAAEASEAASKAAPPEREPDKDAREDAGKVASAETETKEAAPRKSEAPERAIPTPLSDAPAPVVTAPPPVTQPQASEDDNSTKEAAGAGEMAEQVRRQARQREEQIERDEERRREERKRVAHRKEEERKEQRQRKAEQGGATARSSAAAGASSGRVSASAGSILSYAARVRAQVAGHKPSGAGAHGTAMVGFSVTPWGGLGYANIARSSGNPTLDRMAVSAVRGAAPFPQPPSGASPGQLRFTIPFHFQ